MKIYTDMIFLVLFFNKITVIYKDVCEMMCVYK